MRRASDLKGMSIAATDGDIGSVQDLYLDAMTWTVRYLVVDTGAWLPGRKVLVSPMSMRAGVHEHAVSVALTREQVENSPSTDADKPVNRQWEEEYARYFGYPYYWMGPYRWGATPYPAEVVPAEILAAEAAADDRADPMLHSVRAVLDYYIHATDGDIGHVEDILIDDREWAIRYMIVDTRNWWPGKKVLIAPDWITEVSWRDARVHVDLTRAGVKTSPEYDADQPLGREYETRLYRHYGRRGYWD